jgi:DNA repair exonuclease SbcCD ATPase subunit/DNA repair exonuclease SbcCD nuclease subunit
MADIHILGLHRHNEHHEAFEIVAKDAANKKVDHIFIGGDIWHTKTIGISPEYIDLLSSILNRLSSIAPVHITLGNHDFNITNKTRQDAISPIINALDNTRINLYKNSGVYELETDVNLCVFSLYDEENWSLIKPIPGQYNIACYHGAVQGAITDTNWHVEGEVSVDMFKDFNLCMLGDIHIQQFLGYRNYSNGTKPWIGYSGALLQNNYGETINKGYLIWDIDTCNKTHDVEFVNVPSKHPYITLDWEGDVENTILSSLKFPVESRFRIKSDVSLTYSDTNELQRILIDKRLAHEVVFKIDVNRGSVDTIKINNTSMHRNDVRNFEVLFELLKEHVASANLNDEEISQLENKLRTYVNAQQVSNDDVLRGVKWSIDNFKFDNILAYGEDNYINFSNLNGLVGLFGPNKIGKSSIIGALLYAMFNTSDRGSAKALSIINENKDNCSANVVLNINSQKYFIERQSIKRYGKKGVSANTSLNIFNIVDDKKIELKAEQRADTEKVIRRLLGTIDDFLLLNVSVQDGMKGFINEGPTSRKTLISRILDIDYFDKLHELAKDDVNSMKAMMKSMAKRSWNQEIDELNKKLYDNIDTISDLSSKLQISKAKYSDLQVQLAKINTSIISKEELEKLQNNVSKLQNKKNELNNQLELNENNIIEANKKLQIIEEKKLDGLDIDELNSRIEAKNKLEIACENLQNKKIMEQKILSSQERSLLKLLEVPCGDLFPTCKYIKDSFDDKNNIETQRNIVDKLKIELDKLLELLLNVKGENLEERLNKAKKLQSLHNLAKKTIENYEHEIRFIKQEIENNNERLLEAIKKLQDIEKSIDINQQQYVENLYASLKTKEKEIKSIESELLKYERERGSIEFMLTNTKREEQEHNNRASEYKIYELISNSFSKKGIPSKVLRNQLPIINSEIDGILGGAVNFGVELELDEDANTLEIYMIEGNSRRLIEMCSGMEKVISSLAIKVALRNVSTLPKFDMMILDEGFSDLDENGVEICSRLLRSLQKYYKCVMIITHIEALKDIVDMTIEINKENGLTKVQYE